MMSPERLAMEAAQIVRRGGRDRPADFLLDEEDAMKWINGAGARAWLDDKSVAILDREARVYYMAVGIRPISGGWVRNTRRVRKLLRLARRRKAVVRG